MDEELQRLFDAVEQAEQEWKDHRLTGYEMWQGEGPAIGTAPDTRSLAEWAEWRQREEKLKAAFLAAHEAWLSHLPR